MKRLAIGLILAFVVASPVSAGKASATVTLDQPSPAHGDFITFSVTTNSTPTLVRLTCSQDGAVVAIGGWLVHSDTSYTSETIGLYSPAWPSGGADCIAEVKLVTAHPSTRWKTIGSTTFDVAP